MDYWLRLPAVLLSTLKLPHKKSFKLAQEGWVVRYRSYSNPRAA